MHEDAFPPPDQSVAHKQKSFLSHSLIFFLIKHCPSKIRPNRVPGFPPGEHVGSVSCNHGGPHVGWGHLWWVFPLWGFYPGYNYMLF